MKIKRRTPLQVYKLWIKALRSGKYKQGSRCLKDDDKFCCLGVLCDLAAKDGGQQWLEQKSISGKRYFRYAESGLDISQEMMRWLGLTNYDTFSLMTMNDKQNKSFAEIADYIEKHLMKK